MDEALRPWRDGAGSELVPPYEGTKREATIIRFHTASSPFTVERDLRVKIATKRKSSHPDDNGNKVRPGDDVEVTITTTDPQGRPVAAELSLAMVEQSLLERFASPLPSIGDFFRGGERQPAVRCTSSITFSYRPADAADQSAAAGGKGPRGGRARRRGKPQGSDGGGGDIGRFQRRRRAEWRPG